MGNKDLGECSQQTERIENSRPLKKAKYVWQVKGKYHLKSSCQNKTEPVVTDHKDKSCDCSKHDSKEDICKGKCIDKFLAKTETLLDSDEDENVSKNIDKSISNEIPITLVSPYPKNQDYYLRKWQARQIARGYIDNTINSVLETWVSAPFDAEDFVENCDDDGHIEDEGILMAIQAHGLQSNKLNKKGPSLSFVRPDELADNTLDKIDTVRSQIIREGFKMDVPLNSSSSSSDDRDIEAEANFDVVYPVDILNAAILVAIEKKGLSSFNHV
ncbi:hypothetical protein BDFB_002907 [Asbolus verrucosus]|uniref:Uncharacterized protein n=1 Tax=Asbolus verrucosus TaxID=1661398 RepID=A0A482VW46_ASBVE|nr:hypothetical protein BDFB_002907 [Asbolus verrucosus]